MRKRPTISVRRHLCSATPIVACVVGALLRKRPTISVRCHSCSATPIAESGGRLHRSAPTTMAGVCRILGAGAQRFPFGVISILQRRSRKTVGAYTEAPLQQWPAFAVYLAQAPNDSRSTSYLFCSADRGRRWALTQKRPYNNGRRLPYTCASAQRFPFGVISVLQRRSRKAVGAYTEAPLQQWPAFAVYLRKRPTIPVRRHIYSATPIAEDGGRLRRSAPTTIGLRSGCKAQIFRYSDFPSPSSAPASPVFSSSGRATNGATTSPKTSAS